MKRLVGAIGAIALVAAVLWLARSPSPAPKLKTTEHHKAELDPKLWRVPIDDDDPTRGARTPLVTIVQFDDMQSPACAAMDSLLRAIVARHPEDVQWVWKDRPNSAIHPLGATAAAYARYAFVSEGNEGFWRVHDLALKRLATQDAYDVSPTSALFDMQAHERAVAQQRADLNSKIEASMRLAMALDVRVTPHLLINGRSLSGLPSAQALDAIIDEELAAARAQLARAPSRTALLETLRDRGEVPAVKQAPATYGPGRGRIKHVAQTEVDLAALDETPIELSADELAELQKRNIDPEGFKRSIRIDRARARLEAEAQQAKAAAGLE